MVRVLLSAGIATIAATITFAQVGSMIHFGALINDSLRLENTGAFVRLPSDGSIRWGDPNSSAWVGWLVRGALAADRTWTLPDESGTLLTSVTPFGSAAPSDATVSGTHATLDIQLKSGVVGTAELADAAVTNAKLAGNIAVSKLAPGAEGQVLATIGATPQWTTLSIAETDPKVGTLAPGQIAFWGGSTLVGSNNLFWDNTNGQLGIGTSTPTVAIDVVGSARLASAASTTVVIGNVSPDGKLRVGGTIRADAYRSADGTASSPAYRFTNSASTGMFSPGSGQLAFTTGGTERLRIDGSGNLLVASGHLQVQNTDGTARELRLYEPSGAGTDYTAFRAQPQSGSITYTLPASIVAGGVLRTDAVGTLSWQLVDDDPSNDLTTTTVFGSAAPSDATVSGTYSTLDIQLKSGVVGTAELADAAVTNAKLAGNIAVSKLTPGAEGQVLVTQGGVPQWASFSSASETDPEVSVTTLGSVPRWNGTALVDGSLIDDGAGQLSRNGDIAINPGPGYTLSTDGTLSVGYNLTVGNILTVSKGLVVNGSSLLGSSFEASPTVIVNNDSTSPALVVANEGSGGLIWLVSSGSANVIVLDKPTLSTNRVWTLPDLTGTLTVYTNTPSAVGQVLTWTTDGPQWTNPSGSTAETDPEVGTLSTGQVAFWNDTALVGSNNLFWDNTNGRLGIGTSSPSSGLHLHDKHVLLTSSTATNGFTIELSGSNIQLRHNENAEIQFRTNASSGSDTVKLRLTAGGQLLFFAPSNGAQFRIDLPNSLNATVGMGRARAWTIYSSAAMKEDIRPIEGALDKILALRGVQYRWKPAYGGNRDIGFIAEQVGGIIPEAVVRDASTGEYLAMDYMRIVPVLVEALKEEHRQRQQLQERLEVLEREHSSIEELRRELARLQRIVEQLSASEPRDVGVQAEPQWLGANIPNPHDGTTTIPYYLTSGIGRAQLVVADAAGRLVRTIDLPVRSGWSQVTLDLSTLSAGSYEYRLVVDGRVVATRQMQLVK